MKRTTVLIGAALIAGMTTLAAEARPADPNAATAAFRAGNTAYEQGRFDEAAQDYQKAADAGIADARLYFNYGNALFRLNKLGPAILYYERARKLSPADEDVLFNLRFAQARTADKAPEPPANLLTKILWQIHSGYSLNAGVWFAYALFVLAFAGFAAALFLAGAARVSVLTLSGFAIAALLVFSPSLAYKIRQQESVRRAVVLEPVAELYSGPGEGYELLFRVHEGTVFEITERRGDWLAVRLPDGRAGFVRAGKTGEV